MGTPWQRFCLALCARHTLIGTEAAWLKKGKKTYYGYKVHMAADPVYGLVVGGHVTPANRSDMNELGLLLSEIPAEMRRRCYADKGCTSKANRDVVCQEGFKDGIMDKAVRGKQLTHWQKARNKCISSVRCGIERIFGTLKRCRGFARSCYVGQAKVEQEFFLAAPSYNLIVLECCALDRCGAPKVWRYGKKLSRNKCESVPILQEYSDIFFRPILRSGLKLR